MNLDALASPDPLPEFDHATTQARRPTRTPGTIRPLLIIQTGTALPPIRARQGDFPHWFRTALKLHPRHVVTCDVARGERLPHARDFAAAIITGSGAMVTERLDWSERAAAWLRDALQQQLPLLGVCYGHQLLAHALGGEVGYNPRGREIGTVAIRTSAAGQADPLFGACGAEFRAHATHLQSVLQAPSGATLLAHSILDGCHALRYAERAWSVQFHPEFSTRAMRSYIHARRADIVREALDVTAIDAGVQPCPQARQLLPRFLRIARA